MPAQVTEQARAKINLALHVLGRRMDGYHEIDSIVAFAGIADQLVMSEAAHTSLSVDGPFAGAVPPGAENLVLRAIALLRQHVQFSGVHVQLTKNLPVASGIGGGSADAAAAMRGMLALANVELPAATLAALALQLGADVPVCLRGESCRMQGIGETLSALEQLPAPAIVLVNPMQGCGTAAVFKRLALNPGQQYAPAADVARPSTWRNDLSQAAIAEVPAIAHVLRALAGQSVLKDVRMSGSGATCFGLAPSLDVAKQIAEVLQQSHPGWWVVATKLHMR